MELESVGHVSGGRGDETTVCMWVVRMCKGCTQGCGVACIWGGLWVWGDKGSNFVKPKKKGGADEQSQ